MARALGIEARNVDFGCTRLFRSETFIVVRHSSTSNDSRVYFQGNVISPPALDRGVDSASNRNEYQEYSCG
jgi:hypothetical protein